MCLSLLFYKRWTRSSWIDRAFPLAWLVLIAVAGFAWMESGHSALWRGIATLLMVDALGWGVQRQRWINRRMKLKHPIPEPAREQSVFLPRCDVILDSAGKDIRGVATEMQRVYTLAPREASELCERTPALLKSMVWHAEAEFVKQRLEAVGATVELRQRDDDCVGDKD